MITLKGIRLNNTDNKTFLIFNDHITFEENTLYFIIGKSGHGKTSIIDFITAPFTEDPIKNGDIVINGLEDKNEKVFTIRNSHCIGKKYYNDFIRTHVAFIPQKTDSFHPEIPVSKQMFSMYRTAMNRKTIDQWRNNEKDWLDFKKSIPYYSEQAGWESVSIINENCLEINEGSGYYDDDKNNDKDNLEYSIPDSVRMDNKKVWQSQFSSGQKQRMLILNGLMQFSVMNNPILVADEFLVNFSYQEANDVLKKIIGLFSNTTDSNKKKTGIFILHDLSFPALKNLPPNPCLKVKLIALKNKPYKVKAKEKNNDYVDKPGELFLYEILLEDFFNAKWEEDQKLEAVFKPFLDSYLDSPIDKCCVSIKNYDENLDEKLYDTIRIKESPEDGPPKGLYASESGEFEITLKKNKFIVITGFSGVGKSTLCGQILNILKERGNTNFRYIPAHILSALSDDGNTTVYQDLSIMYDFYNGIKDINKDQKVQDIIEDQIKLLPDFSLKGLKKMHIYDLSGGQQQRYWLIRLLLDYYKNEQYKKPSMLVLDESIASLDCHTKNDIIKIILEDYFSKKGYTILIISHDKRDMSIIYNTIYMKLHEIKKEDKISEIFEHYELFQGMLYRVTTPYNNYSMNLENEGVNEYESCRINENGEKTYRHFILKEKSPEGKEKNE